MNRTDFPLLSPSSVIAHVVLADGDFPTHHTPLHLLQTANHLVCCDGAGMRALAEGYHPQAIVGDGDSLPEAFKQQYSNLIHHVDEQEDNDLTKATRYLLANTDARGNTVAFLGATGKREDHTLGNISLMVRYRREMDIEPMMVTNYGWLVVANGPAVFESFPRQQVSIFNISCRERLSATGLRWPTRAYDMLWQGTLNEATGNEMAFNTDGEYMVFRTFEGK
jgi:thiamine pyrophosphokinase